MSIDRLFDASDFATSTGIVAVRCDGAMGDGRCNRTMDMT